MQVSWCRSLESRRAHVTDADSRGTCCMTFGFIRQLSVLSLASTLAALVVGCGDNQDDAGARSLLAQVEAAQYRAWTRAPGYDKRRSSNAPHSDAVDIYVNTIVEATLTKSSVAEWPVGSIIAKDGFSGSDRELTALMEKREDGWFWAEYDSDGDPAYSGKPDICIDCHRSGSDGVRAFRLP